MNMVSKALVQKALAYFNIKDCPLLVNGIHCPKGIDFVRFIESCAPRGELKVIRGDIYYSEPHRMDNGIIIFDGGPDKMFMKTLWIPYLSEWLQHKDNNCLLLFGSREEINNWLDLLKPLKSPQWGPAIRKHSVLIEGALYGSEAVTPTLTDKQPTFIAFYIGGGIGDIIHHYTMSDVIRTAKMLHDEFDNIKICAYVYTSNMEGFNLLKNSDFIYKTIMLDKPIDNIDGWIPNKGEFEITKYFQQMRDRDDLTNKIAKRIDLPKLKGYTKPKGIKNKLEGAILLHPFAHNVAKTFLEENWWKNFTSELLNKNYKVVVVGHPDDADCPLLQGYWDYIQENDNIIKLTDDRSFLFKVGLFRYIKAVVVVDSCWLHVAEHYGKPGILLINEAFYSQVLSYMEDNPYDYNWHPHVRTKLRKLKPELVISDDTDNFHVIFGDKFDTLPTTDEILEHLNQRIKIIGQSGGK